MWEVVTGIMLDAFCVALKSLIPFKLKYLISIGLEALSISEVFLHI
jgi:hypothetical protein